MSIFARMVTGIFGKKSEKDLKILSPYIDEINSVFQPLASLSEDELKNRFQSIQKELKETSINADKTFKIERLEEGDLEDAIQKVEQEFLNTKMVKNKKRT